MPEKEPLLTFKLPDGVEIEAYVLRDATGKIIVRTKEELEAIAQKEKK